MNVAEMFIRALGIEPEQAQRAVQGVVNDAATVKAEVLAAKGGFVAAVGHFQQRLTAIEELLATQNQLLARLADESVSRETPRTPAPNGSAAP